MSNLMIWVVAVLLAAAVSAFHFLFVRRSAGRLLVDAQKQAARIAEDAQRDGEAKVREAELAAKEKLLQARNEFEKASRKRRSELETLERRIAQKEDNLDKRQEELTRREKDAAALERGLGTREKQLETRENELHQLIHEGRHKLEQISGLTAQQAKDELVRSLESEARNDAAHTVKRIEDEAREQASKHAQRIIANAIQRSASDYVAETTVSVVLLPNDEMKGRIIGREGRNIRALETATGGRPDRRRHAGGGDPLGFSHPTREIARV
ncbi:MAG: DUF3552 domain-containing protein, partial [Thermoanaerobaculia bacterium]|nr:DUF3552 domain-containing protein [Thermoanaerobaculia bacterium]